MSLLRHIFLMSAAATNANATQLWISDQADRARLYSIVLEDGSMSGPNPIVYANANVALVDDLATDEVRNPGLIWGLTRTGSALTADISRLLLIDPLNSRELARVDLDRPLNSLAIDSTTGIFYGGDATALYEIDPYLGSTLLIGPSIYAIDGGLGITASGELIATSRTSAGLYHVSKSSGEADWIAGSEEVRLADIAHNPNTSELFGVTTAGSIVTIDIAAGQTSVQSTQRSITRPSGLAILSIPESATSVALATAITIMLLVRLNPRPQSAESSLL
jgi:hypothetical protein